MRVKDVWSRRIVDWATSDGMTSRLADAALSTAISRCQPTGTMIVHSKRGGQFRSRRFQCTLKTHGLIGSMGHVASAGDNAAIESLFALRQNNVVNRYTGKTREDLTVAIIR